MLGGLLVRRYIFAPAGLEISRDDAIMHGLLIAIIITGFVIEGARMAVTELGTPLAFWSPVGLLLAKSMFCLGQQTLLGLHRGIWWLHLLLVMGFFILIPYTKFRHIFTVSANYFFEDLGPKGKLVNLDLEDEEAETFGAASLKEMTWKDIFDADACTLCMRCQDRCPAYNTGKPLSPMKLVNQIGEAAFAGSDADLIDLIGKDVLWSCTTCRACQEICPASIEHVGKIVELRRSMVLMEGEFPGEEVMTAMEAADRPGADPGCGLGALGIGREMVVEGDRAVEIGQGDA